jgi:anti-anti-sigma factor
METNSEFSLEVEPGWLTVHAHGIFHKLPDQEILQRVHDHLAAKTCPLVLDLKNVRMMTSMGVSTLFKLQEEAEKAGTELTLRQPNEEVLNLMNTLHIRSMFKIA